MKKLVVIFVGILLLLYSCGTVRSYAWSTNQYYQTGQYVITGNSYWEPSEDEYSDYYTVYPDYPKLIQQGKNLFDMSIYGTPVTQNGLTISYNSYYDCLVLNGTLTTAGRFAVKQGLDIRLDYGEYATVSQYFISGSVDGVSPETYALPYFGTYVTPSSTTSNNYVVGQNLSTVSELVGEHNLNATSKGFVNGFWLYLTCVGASFTDYMFRLQLERGIVSDTDYVRYKPITSSAASTYTLSTPLNGFAGYHDRIIVDMQARSCMLERWIDPEINTGQYLYNDFPPSLIYTTPVRTELRDTEDGVMIMQFFGDHYQGGYTSGLDDGTVAGYEAGWDVGYNLGYDTGIDLGYSAGWDARTADWDAAIVSGDRSVVGGTVSVIWDGMQDAFAPLLDFEVPFLQIQVRAVIYTLLVLSALLLFWRLVSK